MPPPKPLYIIQADSTMINLFWVILFYSLQLWRIKIKSILILQVAYITFCHVLIIPKNQRKENNKRTDFDKNLPIVQRVTLSDYEDPHGKLKAWFYSNSIHGFNFQMYLYFLLCHISYLYAFLANLRDVT